MHVDIPEDKRAKLSELQQQLEQIYDALCEYVDDLEDMAPVDDGDWEGTSDEAHLDDVVYFLRDACQYATNAARAVTDALEA